MRVTRRQFLLGQLGDLDEIESVDPPVAGSATSPLASWSDRLARLVRRVRPILAYVFTEILVSLGIDDRLQGLWSFLTNVVVLLTVRARLLSPIVLAAAQRDASLAWAWLLRQRGRSRVARVAAMQTGQQLVWQLNRLRAERRDREVWDRAFTMLSAGARRARAEVETAGRVQRTTIGALRARAVAMEPGRIAARTLDVASGVVEPALRRVGEVWRAKGPARDLIPKAARLQIALPLRRPSVRSIRRPSPLTMALIALALAVVAGALAVAAVYSYVTRDLPPADQVFTTGMFQTAMIYDRKGRLLYEMMDPNGGRRNVVPLKDIPKDLIDATVMTEDANFYTNPGVDVVSILRAILQDIKHRQIMSGASTITQQLVRNVVMTPQERQAQTLSRKIGEAILAYRVSQRYSKDEILERYLNEIYYGNLAYGVEAASETYFDKPVQQLTLAQAALIAGLPQAPALYDPYQHPEAAKARQLEVLSLMVRHGAITPEQADAAAKEPLNYHSLPTGLQAPHFVMYVRDLLEDRYSREQIYQGGLHVYTSIDLDLQRQIEAIVRDQMPALAANGASNAAVVAIDPKTGEILAMVGSASFWDETIPGQINMATAERAPGSTIKTFTYLVAIDRGLTMPATLLADAPVQYPMGVGQPPYAPQDADGKFRGTVTLRRALANSLNVPAIGLLDRLGVAELLTMLRRFGITSLQQPPGYYGLSLTLGAAPVQLLDITYGYAAIAHGGVQVGDPVPDAAPDQRAFAPVAILKVTDSQGKVLDDYKPSAGIRLVSPQAAWLTTDILADDAARAETVGAHSPLELPDRPAAAKIGTSENLQDAWTIGYTPSLVVGVWVGNTDGRPMRATFGAQGPAVIWHEVMETALGGQPVEPFAQPPGLVRVAVDAATGLLPAPGRPTITDWFVQGTVPTRAVVVPTPTATPKPTPPPKPREDHPGKGHGKH